MKRNVDLSIKTLQHYSQAASYSYTNSLSKYLIQMNCDSMRLIVINGDAYSYSFHRKIKRIKAYTRRKLNLMVIIQLKKIYKLCFLI